MRTLRSIFLAVALLVTVGTAHAKLTDPEVLALYSDGNELFHKANQASGTDTEEAERLYRRSAMRFEKIVKQGDIHNGRLFYNIGNAYFRIKDIGRAILNYRRAELYTPHDPNLHQNLRAALDRRLDRVEERQQTRILKTVFFWHYDLPTRVRAVTFGVTFVLIWVFAALRLTPHAPRFARGALVLCLILSMLLAGSLTAEVIAARTTRPGVVVDTEVVARKGDSDTYQPSFKESLHAGTEFRLVEARGAWYHIELTDGRRCWVPIRSSALISEFNQGE